ncbi:MAG: DUF1080 domain-containing protein [Cyclobacteriaceae bacterium]
MSELRSACYDSPFINHVKIITLFLASIGLLADIHAQNTSKAIPQGFISLFDGKSLKGWQAADMSWWTVEDGAITARITEDKPYHASVFHLCDIIHISGVKRDTDKDHGMAE